MNSADAKLLPESELHLTTARALLWGWVALSLAWLTMVTWVAITEPTGASPPFAYAMTAVVPPGILLAIGVSVGLTARVFQRKLARRIISNGGTGADQM